MTAFFQVENLRVGFRSFRGRKQVVDGVSFTVAEGEKLGVVGESGSGKSVTMLASMGLLGSSAIIEADKIELRGRDMRGASGRQWAQVLGNEISMVFQNPMTSLNPSMRIGEQISEPIEVHSPATPRADLQATAERMLNEVSIPNPALRVSQYPHEFSGGMRQRAVIGMALSNAPAIVVADEPTTALDVTVQAQIVSLMGDLSTQRDLALILITHDLGLVAESVDRVMIMYAGRVVEETPVANLFDSPAHPYTRALLESRPATGARRGRLNAIPGFPPTSADAVSGCPFHPRCAFSKDREICRTTRPALTEVAEGQRAACHFTDEVLATPVGATVQSEKTEKRAISQDVVLNLEGVRKSFGAVNALNGVDLQIHRGETLGIAGESGCGKSTLARVAMGLVAPTEGRVRIMDTDLAGLEGRALRAARRNVQMVFQDPTSSLDRRMTIRSIIAEPMVIAKWKKADIARRTDELMAQVGLGAQFLDAYPSEMSGGQRQRVGIARALALEPDVVIFDEPTSALDVSIQAQIVNLLDDLRAKTNAGYAFIAHDLGVLRHVSDRVAIMYLGRIVEIGDVDEVFEDPRHPYTRALLDSAPVDHPDLRRDDAFKVEGAPPDPANIPSGCAFRTRCPIATEKCAQTVPALVALSQGNHRAACHYADDTERLAQLTDGPKAPAVPG